MEGHPRNINAYQSIESVTHSLCLERSIYRISNENSPARIGSFKHGRWTIQWEIPLWLVLGWGLWSAGMISTSLEVCELSLKNPILYYIILYIFVCVHITYDHITYGHITYYIYIYIVCNIPNLKRNTPRSYLCDLVSDRSRPWQRISPSHPSRLPWRACNSTFSER